MVVATPGSTPITYLQFLVGKGATETGQLRKLTFTSHILNICQQSNDVAPGAKFILKKIRPGIWEQLECEFKRELMTGYKPPRPEEIRKWNEKGYSKLTEQEKNHMKTSVNKFVNTVCPALRFDGWHDSNVPWKRYHHKTVYDRKVDHACPYYPPSGAGPNRPPPPY